MLFNLKSRKEERDYLNVIMHETAQPVRPCAEASRKAK